MKIQSLQYEDLSTGWKLDLIEFNPQLTLLVGVSGVGKTQILKALLNLKEISQGESLNGVTWNIKFISEKENNCEWSGEFEVNSNVSGLSIEGKIPAYIKNEKLVINGKTIIDRDSEKILFNDVPTVKLALDKSVISLLKEEEQIKEIHTAFKRILFREFELDSWYVTRTINNMDFLLSLYKSNEDVINSEESIKKKLYLISGIETGEIFNKIKDAFINIFPSIEDLGMDLRYLLNSSTNEAYVVTPYISIKEKNVAKWIDEENISLGMLKTLMQLAELYLCSDSSVILIDEFENSLGINCIDEVVFQILASERNLQFIITSHHPYIINKIGYDYWKIVTRKGGVVKCIDAKEFGIGKSKHQAFTQLANLTEYSDGIES